MRSGSSRIPIRFDDGRTDWCHGVVIICCFFAPGGPWHCKIVVAASGSLRAIIQVIRGTNMFNFVDVL